MQIGKVPENILKRSVFKQIHHRRPEVLLHPGVGEDCSAVEAGEGEVLVFSVDPITATEKGMGTFAVHVTANDLASSGAEPVGIMTSIILPPRKREKYLLQNRKHWYSRVQKRLMRHFFCMEKAEGLPFIRWIPEMSILISLWEWNPQRVWAIPLTERITGWFMQHRGCQRSR